MRLTTISGFFSCAAAALTLAAAAQGSLEVGVTEDAGKTADGGAPFFAAMTDVGLKANRVSIDWDPANPTTIHGQTEIAAWLPQAQLANTRVIFAVAPLTVKGQPTMSPGAVTQFVAFMRQLAQTFPSVKDYVVGNEPNQPRFWLPQYSKVGKALSAATYLKVLSQSYDALKAIDPTINVIGIGLSPRGNDQPFASSNPSRSPVRFLHDLGIAYRASHRTKPLMDELAFHPYPSRDGDSPDVGYVWPNAGIPNLDRIKQAIWDAFHGTAQPTFYEPGVKTFTKPLMFELDEVGWQVTIPADLSPLYFGNETSRSTIDEQTQAKYYTDAIEMLACDGTVRALNFFHLMDEPNLDRWQSGLERVDLTPRPSYEAVKNTLKTTEGKCEGTPVKWSHTLHVVSPRTSFGLRNRATTWKKWTFPTGAGEQATFLAGIFPATVGKKAIARRLTSGRPAPLLASKGTIAAKNRVVTFAARRLKPGRYVYAIRMVATMNTQRSSFFVSKPFRVGAATKPHKPKRASKPHKPKRA
ncbi:MAG TPA: hypothetical protein VHQ98_10790 [Gaiellaceae bacterium]|jgi:hypothetical protein|nr:hypothetical protein [Gaiellaceae bacterium]